VRSAGIPKARTIRQIVDRSRAEMRGDLVGERMRSDVSRSGIVIDMLVKWVALTFCCEIKSVLGAFLKSVTLAFGFCMYSPTFNINLSESSSIDTSTKPDDHWDEDRTIWLFCSACASIIRHEY
jgi:hypothetical protein